MAADAGGDLALIDHHVHGVLTGELDRPSFELALSESGAPAAAGTSHFDMPVGLAVRRWCAPLLGLDPHADPDAYLAARAALGAAEVNRRFLSGAGLAMALVETGYRPDEVATPAQMAALAGVPCAEVVRVEAVAESLCRRVASPGEWLTELAGALEGAAAGAVGLKTVVAYREGLDLPVARPDRTDLVHALDGWLAARDAADGAQVRLEAPVLLAEVLHTALEVSGRRGLPLQVHTGFGDTDLQLDRADPARFTPWIRRAGELGTPVVLLHCYPYHRQAGYLAEVFPHVYFDVGCILHHAGPSAPRVLAEALELAPFTKQLYSSDAWGLAEFAYLGALRFRRALAAVLDGWLAADECSAADAEHIAELVARHNARRLYPIAPLLEGGAAPGPARPPALDS